MITIPTTKHFHSDIFIENLDDCLNQQPALALSISVEEENALRWVLGDCLYDDFAKQFEPTDEGFKLKDDAEEKWKWLLYGRTYDFDGFRHYSHGCGCLSSNCRKIEYPGMLKTYTLSKTKSFQKNFVAYYIYYGWKTINETVTAGAGEQIPQVANSATVYNKKKRYNAWNRFADWAEELNIFLTHHREEFPNADPVCSIQRLNIYDI